MAIEKPMFTLMFDKKWPSIVKVGSNISEDQLMAIAERAIVEAKQNLDGKQEPGLGFEDFSSAMKATEIEAKMSVRFHD